MAWRFAETKLRLLQSTSLENSELLSTILFPEALTFSNHFNLCSYYCPDISSKIYYVLILRIVTTIEMRQSLCSPMVTAGLIRPSALSFTNAVACMASTCFKSLRHTKIHSSSVDTSTAAPVTPLFPPGLSPPQHLSARNDKPLPFTNTYSDRILSVQSIMSPPKAFPTFKEPITFTPSVEALTTLTPPDAASIPIIALPHSDNFLNTAADPNATLCIEKPVVNRYIKEEVKVTISSDTLTEDAYTSKDPATPPIMDETFVGTPITADIVEKCNSQESTVTEQDSSTEMALPLEKIIPTPLLVSEKATQVNEVVVEQLIPKGSDNGPRDQITEVIDAGTIDTQYHVQNRTTSRCPQNGLAQASDFKSWFTRMSPLKGHTGVNLTTDTRTSNSRDAAQSIKPPATSIKTLATSVETLDIYTSVPKISPSVPNIPIERAEHEMVTIEDVQLRPLNITHLQTQKLVESATVAVSNEGDADHTFTETVIPLIVQTIPRSISITSSSSSGSNPKTKRLATSNNFDAYLQATKASADKNVIPGTGVFLKTKNASIELPNKYLKCTTVNCQYLTHQHMCDGSHHKRCPNAISSVVRICASFVKFGVCTKSGKSCVNGVHPCSNQSRFNTCNKKGCTHLHELTIDQYGQSLLTMKEPSIMPVINDFEMFWSIKNFKRRFDLEPPGTGTELGPRNDNDWRDYTRFSILPTMDEIIPGRLTVYMPQKKTMFPFSKVLDVGFRHQREAMLGPVRDNVADIIRRIIKGNHLSPNGTDNAETIYTVHPSSTIKRAFIEGGRNAAATFSINFPSPGKAFLKVETVLRKGHLLAILTCSRNKFSIIWAKAMGNWSDRDEQGKCSKTGCVDISLINEETGEHDLENLLQMQSNHSQFWLIDFGGVLPDTFMNGLSVLQQMGRDTLPFAQDLFECRIWDSMFNIPLYLRNRMIDFNSLGHSVINPMGALRADTRWLKSMRNQLAQENSEGVAFTDGQIDAIMNSLCSSLCCIQGPPGTGKSFIGKAIVKLLAVNRRTWSGKKTVPILLTAQTNHALDETIAGYIKCGLKIARLGITRGRESPEPDHVQYQQHMLPRDLSDKYRKACSRAYKDREEAMHVLEHLLEEVSTGSLSWFRVSPFLQQNHPEFFKAFVKTSGDGREADGFNFWASNEDKDEEALLLTGLQKTIPEGLVIEDPPFKLQNQSEAIKSPAPQDTATDDSRERIDPWKLTATDRKSLIAYWKSILNKSLDASILEARKKLKECKDIYDTATAAETAAKMIDFGIDVVACTTTRVAKDYQLLRSLGIEVVIVEEAGEIVESTLLPIFLSSVQQVILIGDHEQLKPFNSYRELTGGDYMHDKSLFERLVTPSTEGAAPTVRLARLDCQRRMRPDIADLVRCLGLYDMLSDGDNVKTYPDVPGMGGNNLLWIDHRCPETFQDRSYFNTYEASMLAGLMAHLIRSGEFGIRDLVIITPYRAQVIAITSALTAEGSFTMAVPADDMDLLIQRNIDYRRPLESTVEEITMVDIKISDIVLVKTVDNYQGQEANVIFYSAVRSNIQGRVGFTDISNRACVTLSRARHGMYIIGNAETARASGNWWSKAANHMKQQGLIVSGIPLEVCSRHLGKTQIINNPSDFKSFRDSESCAMVCATILTCGHICNRKCHPQAMHLLPHLSCASACDRTLDCSHKCVGKCGAPCHCYVQCKKTIKKGDARDHAIKAEPSEKEVISEMCQHGAIRTLCFECLKQVATHSHEDWFLHFSRFYTARARSLAEGKENSTPTREIFLKSLNLSRAGLGDNTYKFGIRMSIFSGFNTEFRLGLKGAEELEEKFGCSGLVGRVEGMKGLVAKAVAEDYEWLRAGLVRLSTSGNSAELFAGVLEKAVEGVLN